MDFIYLASGSPRRRELLRQIGVSFQVLAAPVDERPLPGEAAEQYVLRVAKTKAAAGWTIGGQAGHSPSPVPVLAADTAVIVDGQILSKPRDRADGEQMLQRLAGRAHEVLTGVALATVSGVNVRLSRSEVAFRAITAGEARAYWETEEPLGKAGGYAIQGKAAVFIADLRGSYSGVMGLPLYETAELLDEAAVSRWR